MQGHRRRPLLLLLSHGIVAVLGFQAGISFGSISSIAGEGEISSFETRPHARWTVDRLNSTRILKDLDIGIPRIESSAMYAIRRGDSSPKFPAGCDRVRVVFTQSIDCLAIAHGSVEAPTIHHFAQSKHGWKPVGRQYPDNGPTSLALSPPKPIGTAESMRQMHDYLDVYEQVLSDLKQRVMAIETSQIKPLVVMVSSAGHVPLLTNFVCAAKRVGVNLSSYLLVAIDPETHSAAKGLGLTSFHDNRLFPSLGVDRAATYGTTEYARLMMTKVVVAHLTSSMGVDFVFQDMDIVPLKPDYIIEFVSQAGSADLAFQDDHNESPSYAPWSANSGFYFVRSNARTRYFFADVLRRGDLVLRTKSHQVVVNTVLSEHVSLFGLRVKILTDASHSFPGTAQLSPFDHGALDAPESHRFTVGYHFHHDWSFMKAMIAGEEQPFAFHMNYNENFATKKKFMQQIGHWFLRESCEMTNDCCVNDPIVVCHYRDKPSKVQCPTSPMIESNVSFW